VIPHAPQAAPRSLRESLVTAALAWYDDPDRPRIAPEVSQHWTHLLDAWTSAGDLPLFVRRARGNRGHRLAHTSGRTIIPADNGPAHWSLTLAFRGETPSLDDVRAILGRDEIPVAMAFTAAEKVGAHFRCTRAMIDGPNARGWKVAHIDDIGLGYAGHIEHIDHTMLSEHFRKFLSPSNMFLVPKAYAGVAETPEFVQVFRERRAITNANSKAADI
jgi:hypothetical protein